MNYGSSDFVSITSINNFFFYTFAAIKTKGAELNYKAVIHVACQRPCDYQNFLHLQNNDVLIEFYFWI